MPEKKVFVLPDSLSKSQIISIQVSGIIVSVSGCCIDSTSTEPQKQRINGCKAWLGRNSLVWLGFAVIGKYSGERLNIALVLRS